MGADNGTYFVNKEGKASLISPFCFSLGNQEIPPKTVPRFLEVQLTLV